MEEAPHAPRVGAGAAPPPKPTAPTSHRLAHTAFQTHWARLVSNMGHRSPHLRVLGAHFHHFNNNKGHVLQAGQRAGRTRATGQFSCFGPRSCFIEPVSDITNGIWPLNRAVGRAYIRESVPKRSNAATRNAQLPDPRRGCCRDNKKHENNQGLPKAAARNTKRQTKGPAGFGCAFNSSTSCSLTRRPTCAAKATRGLF